MTFKKGDKAIAPQYGEGTIKSKPLYGYANPANDYDSEAKYDFLPDWGRIPYRLFESELSPVEKITRQEKNESLRKAAVEKAIAGGWALHREDKEVCDWIEATHPRFVELVALTFKLGPTLVMVAPTDLAASLSTEMNNYVIPVSDKSHHLKCNISVPNCRELGDLQVAMNFNVHTNGWTNGFGEVVIYSKDLAKALGDMGVISERVIRKLKETGEESNGEVIHDGELAGLVSA